MRNLDHAERARFRESLVGNGLLLVFGCLVLAFLVSVDRVDWFAIRPATGTSVAMARSIEAAPLSSSPSISQEPAARP